MYKQKCITQFCLEVENYGNFSNRYHVGSIRNYVHFLYAYCFALLETGFSRVKNSSTAWIDNILDFAIASLVFWAFGYGIMFGDSNPFIGDF